jgi:hypothetical protein
MEKSIVTFMKVTDWLTCKFMIEVMSSQTKIRKQLKKVGKFEFMKDLTNEVVDTKIHPKPSTSMLNN